MSPEGPRPPDAATWRRWGIEPSWSRTLEVPDGGGGTHRWHALDTGAPEDRPRDGDGPGDGAHAATILCVHGNPTWGYAWAPLLRRFAGRHRVVAVDQLSMGYSERVGARRYAERVADLSRAVDALGIDPDAPLVVAAHDWGGAIALGWAVERPARRALDRPAERDRPAPVVRGDHEGGVRVDPERVDRPGEVRDPLGVAPRPDPLAVAHRELIDGDDAVASGEAPEERRPGVAPGRVAVDAEDRGGVGTVAGPVAVARTVLGRARVERVPAVRAAAAVRHLEGARPRRLDAPPPPGRRVRRARALGTHRTGPGLTSGFR